MLEHIHGDLLALQGQLATLCKVAEAILVATQSNAQALRDAARSGSPMLTEPAPASSSSQDDPNVPGDWVTFCPIGLQEPVRRFVPRAVEAREANTYSVLKGGESAKRSAPSLTEEQQAIGAQLISNVVRDALDQKRKPSLHDAKCRVLTAANAYVAGVLQINRAVSPAAPNRPASK